MKKTKHIISGILTLAVFTLFFVQCANNEARTPDETVVASEKIPEYLPIAYVDSDSLLIYFNFYNKLIGNYEDKLSKENSSLNSGYQKFQSEVKNFEQKVRDNAYLTQERAMQDQTRLQRMQQDLEKKASQMQQELALEERLIQQQLSDSLALGMKEYNTPQKYQMIFTKTGNSTILYADEHYNITNEVIDFLNERFKAD